MALLHGFDVSAFQGTSVPRADFIFIKATEGKSYTSSRFAAQWADAKRKGMLRGAYHFARPEASSGASQADRLLARADAVPGEMLCLDLEASDLNQAQTNAWARAFGDRLREKAPGVTTVVYMGSGYASNNTGKGLADHFDFWWYPQYPSAAKTSTWRTAFDPWLPSGITTGWERPHIWQFTSNFGGLDASISTLTLDQLAHGGHPAPQPQEEDIMAQRAGQVHARENVPNGYSIAEFSFPVGSVKAIGLTCDNTYSNTDAGYAPQPPAAVRVSAHRKGSKGQVWDDVKVGGTGGWPDKVVLHITTPADTDYVTVVRLDHDNKRPVGVDMS